MNTLRTRNVSTLRSALGACWFGMALSGVLLVSSQAGAQVACGDTTCEKGFECQVLQGGACPAIACLDGTDCKPCTTTESYACSPAACSTDADCGPNMVCFEQSSVNCPTQVAPACPRGETCETPEATTVPVTCTTTTTKQCAYRWQVPCLASVDCGAGFTCEDQESCMCSASSGSAGVATPSDGGTATTTTTDVAVPTEPQCSCTPTGTKACELVIAACTVDSDCASGWTCQANPSGVCRVDSTGQSSCTTPDPARYCVPPGWGTTRGAVLQGTVATSTESGATNTIPPTAASNDSAATSNDSAAPAAPAAAEPNDPALQTAGGGCSVGSAPGQAWGWIALGLGALLGIRRRRG